MVVQMVNYNDMTLEKVYELYEKYGLVTNINDGRAWICIDI